MKEEQLFDPMVAYLKKEGYSILEQHRGHEHGTDIIAAKDDYKFWLELKGDSKAYDVDFGTLVYQIMKKMDGLSADKYGLGKERDVKEYFKFANNLSIML